VVIFQRLSKEQITRIVDLQVAQLVDRVGERGVEVELTDGARELLANLGWDPDYGARPLKRVIQKRLVDKLALAMLEGKFGEGDTVVVDNGAGELVFERTPRPSEAEPVAA
jgi:ATP-dependent Clp protease ATP-binding subunit ClpB